MAEVGDATVNGEKPRENLVSSCVWRNPTPVTLGGLIYTGQCNKYLTHSHAEESSLKLVYSLKEKQPSECGSCRFESGYAYRVYSYPYKLI